MDVNKNLLIYVVEDNRVYNKLVVKFLNDQGFSNVKSFLAGKECIMDVKKGGRPDVVIQDYTLEDMTGLDVLVNVKKLSKKSEFIFFTGNESMEVAINTIKYGAYDYIVKDNDVAFKKMLDKIGKISRLQELQGHHNTTNKLMLIIIAVLVAIVIFFILHFAYDAFGLRQDFGIIR